MAITKKLRTVRVHANPWHALNHEGTPQAAVPTPGTRGHYIGAHIDPILSAKTGKICFYFPPGVIELPFGREIATAVRDGSLLPDDEATHKLCECAGSFVPQPKRSDAERARAFADWKANYGDAIPLDPSTSVPTKGTPAVEAAPDAKPTTEISAGIQLAPKE